MGRIFGEYSLFHAFVSKEAPGKEEKKQGREFPKINGVSSKRPHSERQIVRKYYREGPTGLRPISSSRPIVTSSASPLAFSSLGATVDADDGEVVDDTQASQPSQHVSRNESVREGHRLRDEIANQMWADYQLARSRHRR
ncbi:PREDICTED: uncharacterized protein LOC104593602 isoform X1 [Nelumbo nucifera]|uniref:Uncharacterized protein LOC104593602 isoform X1 n=1 Tax=Nelumbo nucifera TaxID=4432 RepID=A0A1U7ZFY7_NELNU|nr:PREDICTED: uncharacterized protein LOC104593602 isoform X1 [Nelumbo nucifera]